jgi:hypothetical protein
MPADNDQMVYDRMKYLGLQTTVSQEIKSRFNKNTVSKYYDEELAEGNEQWWGE